MRQVHYVTIAVAVVLVAALYFGGNIKPPASAAERPGMGGGGAVRDRMPQTKPASADSLIAEARKNLSGAESGKIAALDTKISACRDSAAMSSLFADQAQNWVAAKNPRIAAYYSGLAAKLDNSEKKLTFAARVFSDLMLEEENPAIRMWEAQAAADLAERSYKLDTSIEETKLTLATAYIEGTGEPMKGVQLLLGIVSQKPADIPANLLLGKMSVQSGQLDKAVTRFETVLKVDSMNKEALYYLAQTYKEKGDKGKARQLLEKCIRAVNDPEFTQKANEEISLLK